MGGKPTKPKNNSLISQSEKSAKDLFSQTRTQWGLVCKGEVLPLIRVKFEATINDNSAEWKVIQEYDNNSTEPQEAVFQFGLLEEQGVLCGLDLQVGNKKIHGVVKEKEEAANQYDDSISSGHGAVLLEKKDDNLWSLSLGSLAPNEKVIVELKIVSLLIDYHGELFFPLPLSLFPLSNYSLEIEISVNSTQNLKKIEASHKNAKISKKNEKSALISFKGSGNEIKETFFISLIPETPLKLDVLIEKNESEKTNAISITFFPTWNHIDPDLLAPQSELIFCIDCSGSMSGERISQARAAMKLFLNSLPATSKFNIYRFGSGYKSLWPQSMDYNDESLEKAFRLAENLEADLGGTELLPPLKAIFKAPQHDDFPRQVFVLTDGQVSNTGQLLNFCKDNSKTARIFSVGIGAGADSVLVKGLADAGRGQHIMIDRPDEMEKIVIQLLKKALEPCLTRIKMDWGNLSNVEQTPFQVRPVFNGERMTIQALVSGPIEKSTEIKLTGLGPEGTDLSFSANIDPSHAKNGITLHRLAAQGLIRDLVSGKSQKKDMNPDEIKKKVVELGVKYSIASTHTSFVAVNERNEPIEASMVKKVIPTIDYESDSISVPLSQRLVVSNSAASPYASLPMSSGFARSSSIAQGPPAPKANFSSFKSKDKMKKQSSVSKDESLDDECEEQNVISNLISYAPLQEQSKMKESEKKEMKRDSSPALSQGPRSGVLTFQIVTSRQKALGNWNLNDIQWLTGLSSEVITKANPVSSSVTSAEDIFCTLIALALLSEKFSGQKDKWGLVHEKAVKWIKRTLSQQKETQTFDSLMETTSKWLHQQKIQG